MLVKDDADEVAALAADMLAASENGFLGSQSGRGRHRPLGSLEDSPR